MKVFQVLVDIFCIFAFLTIGSLMMIVALEILPMEEALIKVQDLYESPPVRFQLAGIGLWLVFVGIFMSRELVKKTRAEDEFVIVGEHGQITVTYHSVNEMVQRILRRFEKVRKVQVSSRFAGGALSIRLALTLVQNCHLPSLLVDVEHAVKERIEKTLGEQVHIDVTANVVTIEEAVLEAAETHT